MKRRLLDLGLALGLAAVAVLANAQANAQVQAPAPALSLKPAMRVDHASTAALLGSARAGARLVAVGDHGVVLLSDDEGRHWRQASAVPVRSMLTSVAFADARRGWAVGHWGVVLATTDGGETWLVQRSDVTQDRPLFSVAALDATHLVAVGLWSLVLTSADAGATWQTETLEPPLSADGKASKRADLNLFQLFADAEGHLFAAAERGTLLRSDDRGHHWRYLSSGYKGSFWTGVSPAPGVLIAAGLRGSIYRSADAGQSWARIDSHGKSSIAAALSAPGGLELVGMDGLVLRSTDQGASFTSTPRADRAELTSALALPDGRVALFSRAGIVRD